MSGIEVLEEQMATIEDDVTAVVYAPLPFERVLWSVEDVGIIIPAPSMSLRTGTFNNGGGDFYATQLSYAVWWTPPSTSVASGLTSPVRLVDGGAGMMLPNTPIPAFRSSRWSWFDFAWNMRVGSSQKNYMLPSIAGDAFVSRRAMGNMERGDFYDLGSPGMLIPMGDRLTFTIQPLGFQWTNPIGGSDPPPVLSLGGKFAVHISVHGYRSGTK